MRTLRTITLDDARVIAEAVLDTAKSDADLAPVCIVVCDVTGEPLVMLTMDSCAPSSVTVAWNKAYTVIQSGGKATSVYAERMKTQGLDPHNWNNPRMTAFGGGLPIIVDGKLVGAIGVSGRTSAQDAELGEQGITGWQK